MWHEARRHEKATQKLFNDHKRRAEKRREDNKVDPNSLLQINGIKSRLNLDPKVYKQAIKSLVAWQGDKNVTIDRFDIRATLTSIPTESSQTKAAKYTSDNSQQPSSSSRGYTVLDVNESESMKRILNYERYRLLIQCDLDKVPEELRLKLVAKSDFSSDAKMRKLCNNRFGTSGETDQLMMNSNRPYHPSKMEKQPPSKKKGAAIGFSYNAVPPPPSLLNLPQPEDSVDSEQPQKSASITVDLEKSDNFEIDNVSISYRADRKKVNETVRRYGLSCKEFTLLAQWDGQDIGNGEILKELNQLDDDVKKKKVVRTDSTNETANVASKQESQVYGPALPLELLSATSQQEHQKPPSVSSLLSSCGSQVVHKSPSRADITLRYRSDEEKSHSRSRSKNRSPPSDAMVPRRASTPLAYKRNRSSSREKRNHYRSSRRRRRSSSSNSSSAPSPRYPSPSSDSSDERRRRRRRSRSPLRRRRRR